MGSDHGKRTGLLVRCCQGASFGFGLVVTVLTLAVMFWIAWCYFGLTIIQMSETQRRAVVNYSYTTAKPSPSPTSSPVRSTTILPEETSINSISKLPTTASVFRGTSRGESPAKVDRKKETPEVVSSLAKGDFASRDRLTHSVPAVESRDSSTFEISSPRGPLKAQDETPIAGILSGSSEESEEDRIYARRVMPPGAENRPEDKVEPDNRPIRRNPSESASDSQPDISPTRVHVIDVGSSRRPQEHEVDRTTIDEGKTQPREYIDRDKDTLPRRDDIPRSDPKSVYREPDFDREYSRKPSDVDRDRERSRYDDLDDERGSRSRYDKRDRGRDSDDRYSKGDTRVYPEERPSSDDRYRDRVRERYPEDTRRRGDDDRYDDRYRDSDERPRYRDREIARSDRDRPLDDRTPAKDDRYRDYDDRYRSSSDDRYRSRDDDKYRSRDDERYKLDDGDKNRSRTEDRYRDRDGDRYRTKDEDTYRDDDRYVYRDDDRYRRDPIDRRDSVSRYKDEDRYSSRTDEGRYIDVSPSRRRDDDIRKSVSKSSSGDFDEDRKYSDERDKYRSRIDDPINVDVSPSRSRDENFRESIPRSSSDVPARDRQLSSSRSGYDERNVETVSDYDIGARERSRSYGRDDLNPTRKFRPAEEERYKDVERRPSRYEEGEKRISPTRTRIEDSNSRSSVVDSRLRDLVGDSRYINDERDSRKRDDRYYEQDDKIRSTVVQDSRGSMASRDSSRTLPNGREEYRTRLPNVKTEKDRILDRGEKEVLDHRSYASEVGDEYRSKDSRRDYDDEERSRRPTEETRRRYSDSEKYTERDQTDDEKYKRGRTRGSYDDDSPRSRDRYVDDTRRYDDRYVSRDDDRYTSRDDRPPPLPMRKYDTYPDEEERTRRRDSELSIARKEDSIDRGDRPRSSIPLKSEERYLSKDEYSESKPPSRRRFDDDLSLPDSRDYKDDYRDDSRRSDAARRPGNAKETMIGSSMTSVYSREPSDVVVREKRFQNTENIAQSSRVSAVNDRSYMDSRSESRSGDNVRPLSAKDVIEAAMRHSDTSNQNQRKVYYPVFDPRISNLTSPEIIRPSERRGTTITAKKRRSA